MDFDPSKIYGQKYVSLVFNNFRQIKFLFDSHCTPDHRIFSILVGTHFLIDPWGIKVDELGVLERLLKIFSQQIKLYKQRKEKVCWKSEDDTLCGWGNVIKALTHAQSRWRGKLSEREGWLAQLFQQFSNSSQSLSWVVVEKTRKIVERLCSLSEYRF